VWLSYVQSHVQTGNHALPSDFLNYYTAGRTLLENPAELYEPAAERERQRSVAGGDIAYPAAFQNMPQVALLFVPLALAPYGPAYLLWSALNLALLAASAWLIAPRHPRWPGWVSWSLWVLVVLGGYVPAQLALVDGQTTFLALLGVCAWLAQGLERRPSSSSAAAAGALWLLTWAWKVPLLPVPLLALVLSRAVGRAALLVGLQVVALAAVVALAGPHILQRYVTLLQSAAGADASGQTVFGLVQALGQPGPPSAIAAALVAGLGWAAFASVWWGGLRPDARRLLQFASVPLAAVLLAARAYAYELTLWLASAWLLLRFIGETREQRTDWLLPSLLVLVWLAATLTTLSNDVGVPWSALAGLGLLAAVVWHYHAWRAVTAASAVHPPGLGRLAASPASALGPWPDSER
jgi:hypothetical protein